MESMQELIPFARELLSQKPNRGLLKVYMVGSAFAVLGTVIGLVETICHPFLSDEPIDEDMIPVFTPEQAVEAETQRTAWGWEAEEDEEEEKEEEEKKKEKELATIQNMTLSKTHTHQRTIIHRQHAS